MKGEGEDVCAIRLSDGSDWVIAAAAPSPEGDCNNCISCKYTLLLPITKERADNTITMELANNTFSALNLKVVFKMSSHIFL